MATSTFRSRLMLLLGVSGVLVLLVCGCGMTYFASLFREPRGQVTDRAEWPQALRELQAKLVAAGVGENDFEVYHLHGGVRGGPLSIEICRVPDTPAAWNTLQRELMLHPTDSFELRVWAPPDWWPTNGGTQRYTSDSLVNYRETDQYWVVRQASPAMIFLYHKFDF